MRLGVSTSFSFQNAEDWIVKHKDLGCETVVFPLSCTEEKDKVQSFAKAAKENDITIAEVGIWRNTLSADPAEREANIKYAIGQLQMAEEIGARCCVNVAGTPHGSRWDGGYRDNFSKQTRKDIISMVRTIIDEVKPTHTKFTLEPMPWMVPADPDDYLRLIEEVDRDAFGVHLDVINMVTSPQKYFYLDEFLDEIFEKLGDKILSCHLKDIVLLPDYTFCLKECACGEGILNIKKYAELATKVDKDMPMIIEHLTSDEAYLDSFRYVRSVID